MPTLTAFDPIRFSDEGEQWFEFSDGDERRRLAFHDYAGIYAVPGLYERVFRDELRMCSAEVVVGLWADAVAGTGRDPSRERVLDVGAGNGIGGDHLRGVGVERLVGLDLEPEARRAALRDRPGAYDDYLTRDLMTCDLDDLQAERLTSVLALSAVGVGHLPAAALERVLGLLEPGGLYAFAVTPVLLPGSTDGDGLATGYPELIGRLLSDGRELARVEYVHRRQTDGSPHHAVALVGRT